MRIAVSFLFLAIFLVLHPSAQGQTNDSTSAIGAGRAEEWRQQRLNKFKKLEPYHQGGFEKGLLWLEQKGFQEIFNINYHGIYPRMANLSTGSGLAPGVRLWRPNIRGNRFLDVQAFAAWSLRGYKLYEVQFGKFHEKSMEYILSANAIGGGPEADIIPRDKRSFFYADLQYRDFPQEDFFGIGPDSRNADRTDYQIKEGSFDAVGGYQFNRFFGAGLRLGFSEVEIGEGTDNRFPSTQSLFNNVTAPGLNDQPDFFHASGTLLFDYRDKPGNPHKGGLLGVSYSRYTDRSAHQFNFNRFAFDARQFLPLGSPQRVLAFRFFTSSDNPDSNSRVPFYMQDSLGGSQTLRGYREFRFRDTNLLYLSGEYRWEAATGIEGALFYDAGRVFPDTDSFGFNDLKTSWGFGVRFKTRTAVVFRVDVGHSQEGTRIFFKFAPSF
jgi:hypothetical protein